MEKYTHITKYGFGGLLKAGFLCTIYYQSGNNVSIIIEDNGIWNANKSRVWHGNINDLTAIS